MHTCDVCGEPRLLLARIEDLLACAGCWKKRGAKVWYPPKDASVLFHHETANREAMTRRGGTDRHLVRNGLA